MKTSIIPKGKPTNAWFKTFSSILLIALIFGFSSCQDESSNQLTEDYLKGLELGTLSGTSQNAPVVYFEKTRFTRTSDAPFEEIIRLENPDFEHFSGDFMLKIQNGSDKQTRVSSAEIIIDGETIVSQSDFSKKVLNITKRLQGLTPESVMEVRLSSAPGSFIEIWIEGTVKKDHALVTKDGGTFAFLDNSLIIIVPQGAIADPTFITIKNIQNELSNEIKSVLADAFEFLPDGLRFSVPVDVVIQLPEDVQVSDAPVMLQFNPASGFALEMNCTPDFTNKTLQFELNHFSTYGYIKTGLMNWTFSLFKGRDFYYKLVDSPINHELFQPGIGDDDFFKLARKDVSRAFIRWEAYSSHFSTHFFETTTDQPDIYVRFISPEDAYDEYRGRNGSYIDPLQYEGNETVIATVLRNLNDLSKRWILCNNFYSWISSDIFSSNETSFGNWKGISIESNLTHEIGHLFGLIDIHKPLMGFKNLSIMGYNSYAGYYPISIFSYDLLNIITNYQFIPGFGSASIMESVNETNSLTFSPGEYVEDPLKVKVADNRGKGVPGVTVIFYSGSEQSLGEISNLIAVTDINGVAKINSWTLPSHTGTFLLTAKAWLDPAGINQIGDEEGKDIVRVVNYEINVVDDNGSGQFYQNSFSGSLEDWVPLGGSWQIQNGRLIANYGIGCGSIGCPQADLLLKDQFQPSGDWELSVDFTYAPDNSYNYGASGAAIIIWESPSKKIRLGIGNGGTVPWGTNPETIMPVSFCAWDGSWDNSRWNYINYTWNPKDWHTMTIDKTGNVYTVYVDDDYLWRYTDNYMNGTGKIGLQTYGPKIYDNFIIRTKD